MAIAVQSSSSTVFAASATVVVTKPAGLAVGDLMYGQFIFNNNGVPGTTGTLPSGFTLDKQNAASDYENVTCYKIATSADVAASNFTFTAPNAIGAAAGILRISDFAAGMPIKESEGQTNVSSGNPTFTGIDITPFADSLLVFAICTSGNGGGSPGAVSNYAIANSNPTWTEAWDFQTTLGGDAGMALAYAVRTQSTATGNPSITATVPQSSAACLASIPQSKDVAVTESLTLTEVRNFDIGLTTNDVLTLTETVSASENRFWATQDKSSSTWINIDKS